MKQINIKIIKTPDFDTDKYLDTVFFLQSFEGPLNFIEDWELLPPDQEAETYSDAENDSNKNSEENYTLGENGNDLSPTQLKYSKWLSYYETNIVSGKDSLNHFCNYYRQENKTNDNDIVIILANRERAKDAEKIYHDNNNAIVAIADWNINPKINDINAITFLVIALIREIIAKSKIEKNQKPFEEKQSIVLSRSKDKISKKKYGRLNAGELQEGVIAVSVKLQKFLFNDVQTNILLHEGVEKRNLLVQIANIFEVIDDIGRLKNHAPVSITNKKSKKEKVDPDYQLQSGILLFRNGKVHFMNYNLNLYLPKVQMAIYVYFLIACDEAGVHKSGLKSAMKEKFIYIYNMYYEDFNYSKDPARIFENMFERKENKSILFNSYRSSIKRSLCKFLGDSRAEVNMIKTLARDHIGITVAKQDIWINDSYLNKCKTIKAVRFDPQM